MPYTGPGESMGLILPLYVVALVGYVTCCCVSAYRYGNYSPDPVANATYAANTALKTLADLAAPTVSAATVVNATQAANTALETLKKLAAPTARAVSENEAAHMLRVVNATEAANTTLKTLADLATPAALAAPENKAAHTHKVANATQAAKTAIETLKNLAAPAAPTSSFALRVSGYVSNLFPKRTDGSASQPLLPGGRAPRQSSV